MSDKNAQYSPLDLRVLNDKKRKTVSLEESLKDIVPIKWDREILEGQRKITLTEIFSFWVRTLPLFVLF